MRPSDISETDSVETPSTVYFDAMFLADIRNSEIESRFGLNQMIPRHKFLDVSANFLELTTFLLNSARFSC
jgi:hypothetical protein